MHRISERSSALAVFRKKSLSSYRIGSWQCSDARAMDICSARVLCGSKHICSLRILRGSVHSLSVPKTTSSSAISHKSLEHGTWNNKKKQEFNNKYGKVHKQENWNQMKGAVERRRLGKSLHSLSRTTIPDCAFSLPSAYAPRRFENIFVVDLRL